MKRTPPRQDTIDLDAAIYSCVCTFCGAQPNEACRQRKTTRIFPDQKSASFPHMARVHAGHAVMAKKTVKE